MRCIRDNARKKVFPHGLVENNGNVQQSEERVSYSSEFKSPAAVSELVIIMQIPALIAHGKVNERRLGFDLAEPIKYYEAQHIA